jgi:ribosome-associated protein
MSKRPAEPSALDAELAGSEDSAPSKSQLKRELLALQQLGERLTRLSASQLARMSLSNALREALTEASRIKSHSALRRHYRRLGKLLRDEDLAPIRQVIDEIDGRHRLGVDRFHALERWRERLLDGDSDDFGEFLASFPSADRQHLRHLIQAVHRERAREQPPAAYRKLFKYLREVSGL